MECSTLADFRQKLYACFGNARDALMNTCDALLTQTNARSFVELSLSPFFVRRWPSLYEALEDAQIDRQALETLFVQAAGQPGAGSRMVLAHWSQVKVQPDLSRGVALLIWGQQTGCAPTFGGLPAPLGRFHGRKLLLNRLGKPLKYGYQATINP
jgi:hypothetical protein